MSLNVLQKFIECLKEQNPELDDLDILIALRASGLRGSEIYQVSPQIATKYQRLKEAEASSNTARQEEERGEKKQEDSRGYRWLKDPQIDRTLSESEGSTN